MLTAVRFGVTLGSFLQASGAARSLCVRMGGRSALWEGGLGDCSRCPASPEGSGPEGRALLQAAPLSVLVPWSQADLGLSPRS